MSLFIINIVIMIISYTNSYTLTSMKSQEYFNTLNPLSIQLTRTLNIYYFMIDMITLLSLAIVNCFINV